MDPLIKSQLLYQLSYAPANRCEVRFIGGSPGLRKQKNAPESGYGSPPPRPSWTSRWTLTHCTTPKPHISVSITVPP